MSDYRQRGFDPDRDIRSMRGEFFNTSPTSMLDTRGLTGMQADFLEGEFVNRILPLHKELSALEDRRSQREYNDLRLQEQTFAFEEAREESKRKREVLTRMPGLMQDLGEVDEFAESDPEAAAKRLLQIQRENADVYVSNPAFQTIFDATGSRVANTSATRKAQENADLEYNAKFVAHEDPEVAALGKSRMAADGLSAREQQILEGAGVLKGAEARARSVASEVAAAKTWQEDLLSEFDRDLKRLDAIKSEKPDAIASLGGDPVAAAKRIIPDEDLSMLRDYAVKYKIANPDPDPLRLRGQIYEGLTLMKQQLRSGATGSNLATGMRGPAAKK